MQKSIIIGIAIAALFVGGIAVYLTSSDYNDNGTATSQQTNGSAESANGDIESSDHLDGAVIGETVDARGEDEVEISIDDFLFEQTVVTIDAGTTVTWTNNGNAGHDVVSASESPMSGLDSSLLGNGDTYSFTFDEAGTYEYICTPHPNQMRAVIEVVEG